MEIKNSTFKNYFNKIRPYLIIFVVSVILLLPIATGNYLHGHDILYHLQAINSLDIAYKNGSFFSRIYELTCQDYGYATGLFYSMIPSSFIVIIKNIFCVPAYVAIGIELMIVLFLSGSITYIIFNKITKNSNKSILYSLLYIVFPYVLSNIYIRFALTETFLTFLIPLIFLSLYELIEEKDYFKFSLCFIIGFSLSIMIHFTMTIYIAIFAFIYLMLNFKKFFNKKNLIIFSIDSAIVLLISATYYIPMLVVQKDILLAENLAQSPKVLWYTVFDFIVNFEMRNLFLVIPFILIITTFIIFILTFIINRKNNKKIHKQLLVMSSILVFLITPLAIIWVFIGKTPLKMIQFPWRLYLICAMLNIFQIIYLVSKIKFNIGKILIVSSYVVFCFFAAIINIFLVENEISKDFNNRVNILSTNFGCGTAKHGDYLPIGATMDYVKNRSGNMILETNVEVIEFTNYQSIDQVCFNISNKNEGYAVIKIPYSICDNISIYQYNTFYPFEKYELEISSKIIDETEYLMIKFVDYVITREYTYTSKIIIDYKDSEKLSSYLKENPFEFIVINDVENTTFTNFVKENSHTYSVDITAEKITKIELPTLYYSGYKVTYQTTSGVVELDAKRSENGFIEIEISESGTLFVEYKPIFVIISNVISIIGLLIFIAFMILLYRYEKRIKVCENETKKLENETQDKIVEDKQEIVEVIEGN